MQSFIIPLGTEIYPYSIENNKAGIGVGTSIEVSFSELDIKKKVNRGNEEYYCLLLDENNSIYDSYLVNINKVIKQ